MDYTVNFYINDRVTQTLNNVVKKLEKIRNLSRTVDNTLTKTFGEHHKKLQQIDKQYKVIERDVVAYGNKASKTLSNVNSKLEKQKQLLGTKSASGGGGLGLIGSLGKLGGALAVAGAAMVAFKKGVDVAVKSLKLADTQLQAEAQVKAGMKSTGNAAGLTFDEYKELASNIQNKTTYGDEEVLRNSIAILQTFTQIKGEVFKQATMASADIAAKTGVSLRSASTMIGKALNDPIRGIAALSRVGVQFSETQREQIKRYVELGQVEKAQAVMLKELQTEFGGSAEAMANTGLGAWKQMQNTFGDLLEILGMKLMPVVRDVAKFLNKTIGGIINLLTGAAKAPEWLQPYIDAIGIYKNMLKDLFSSTKNSGEGFKKLGDFLKKVLNVIFKWYKVLMIFYAVIVKLSKYIFDTLIVASIKTAKWFNNMMKKIKDWFKNTFTGAYNFMINIGKKITDWYNGIIKKITDWLHKLGIKTSGFSIGGGKKEETLTTKPTKDASLDFGGPDMPSTPGGKLANSVTLSTDRSVKNYNIVVEKMVESLNVITQTLSESEEEIEQKIIDLFKRALADIAVV